MTLQVIRSGRNIDEEVLAELMKGNNSEEVLLAATPEVLSAAYARISRDPRPVNELRADARKEVEKSRKSTENIVFTMGHHSVAEHAVLNFDVMGLSRLAVEALEQHRLCSYTEKSQRYITLKGDFVVPEEIKGKPFEKEFRNLVEKVQNPFYFNNLEVLEQWHTQNSETLLQQMIIVPENKQFKTREAYEARKKATIKGWAKEDARYALSMATEAQLGFTANARNLEHIIRKFKYHQLAEVRELGAKLYASAREVIPSLIILADEKEFAKTQKATLNEEFLRLAWVDQLTANLIVLNQADSPEKERKLLTNANEVDKEVISALIVGRRSMPLVRAHHIYDNMHPETRVNYVKKCLEHLSEFDTVPREFEMGEFTFDAVMSSSCYAQLKRHRMCTQLPGAYDLQLGVTVPASIKGIGKEKEFLEVMDKSAAMYETLGGGKWSAAADYCLTNAHRRSVISKINLRGLYHFSRLREGAHAQWEIRELANDMCKEARKVAPATTILLGGKSEFAFIRTQVYGEPQ
ncbi:MAG: FAD-dependent thymidylate synthase [Nanoarchaeota archaeon]